MNANRDIIVLCAGGHARVVLDILRRCGQTVSAITDKNSSLHGTKFDDVPIIGDDSLLLERDPKSVFLVNGLGNAPAVGNSLLLARREVFEKVSTKGFEFIQIGSPDSFVSKRTKLGPGCHVITGAIINPGCSVGVNAIINTGAQLDHDCTIGDHSHIAPGAVLSGSVTIGTECHVGAGAVIVQGIRVGDGAVVGAGAVVIGDVPPGVTVVGNPAKPKDGGP
jgi:sugar O-acyltransferase (sialic acid O-acetyltransferase NeuD family)